LRREPWAAPSKKSQGRGRINVGRGTRDEISLGRGTEGRKVEWIERRRRFGGEGSISSKIAWFMASQMPQAVMRGRDLWGGWKGKRARS
jgi:hypothetical protein